MSFPVSDAAFEGFRIARERPKSVLFWALVYFLFSTLAIVLIIQVLGPDAALLFVQPPQSQMTQAETLRLFGVAGKLYAILGPIVLVFGSAMSCAVYRAVLRPEEEGLPLRFGGDEIRLVGLWILLALIVFGAIFVVAFVLTFFAALIGAAAGAAAAGVVSGIVFVGMICAMIWLSVRLSLAAPMTFAERRIRIRDAWALTKGHFWHLAGCYLLAAIFSLIVVLLGLVIAFALSAVTGGGLGAIGELIKPDMTSFSTYFSPVRWVYMAVAALLTAMQYVILMAPPAVAYQVLSAERAS